MRRTRAPRVRGEERGANVSFDLQGEGSGDDAAVDLRLKEQPPRPGNGNENADAQLSRRRRATRDLRSAEEAGATARTGRADVGVEVVERLLAEEDRVRERAEPRTETSGPTLFVGDADRQECGLDRLQTRIAVQLEPEAVGLDRLAG